MAQCQGLDQHVADGCCLYGTRDDPTAGRIGCELVQQPVLGTTAKYVNGWQLASHDLVQPLGNPAVLQCQALQRAADDLTFGLGHGLACIVAEGLDAGRHVSGRQEATVAQRDERAKSRRPGGHLGEVIVRVGLAGTRPIAATFLHQPQTHDVLEEAEGTVHAAFVGKVVGQALLVDDRLPDLHTHQGPGAGAEVDIVVPRGRDRSHGRSSVVRSRRNDGDRAAGRLFGHRCA